MMIAKAMLRIAGRCYAPGEHVDAPQKTIEKLRQVGLVTASIEPEETAAMPKAKTRRKKVSK